MKWIAIAITVSKKTILFPCGGLINRRTKMKVECPKCKKETLDFMEDSSCGEAEKWYCINSECFAFFKVPTEIIRDWDSIQEVAK